LSIRTIEKGKRGKKGEQLIHRGSPVHLAVQHVFWGKKKGEGGERNVRNILGGLHLWGALSWSCVLRQRKKEEKKKGGGRGRGPTLKRMKEGFSPGRVVGLSNRCSSPAGEKKRERGGKGKGEGAPLSSFEWASNLF